MIGIIFTLIIVVVACYNSLSEAQPEQTSNTDRYETIGTIGPIDIDSLVEKEARPKPEDQELEELKRKLGSARPNSTVPCTGVGNVCIESTIVNSARMTEAEMDDNRYGFDRPKPEYTGRYVILS